MKSQVIIALNVFVKGILWWCAEHRRIRVKLFWLETKNWKKKERKMNKKPIRK